MIFIDDVIFADLIIYDDIPISNIMSDIEVLNKINNVR